MSDNIRRSVISSRATEYDQGLRAYMIQVFNYMCIALAITGLTSFITLNSPLQELFFTRTGGFSGLGWLLTFAPLIFVLFFSYNINRMSASTAQLMLWSYSGLMGLSLTPIFMAYTGESIARAFFITSSVFAAMSLYGYTTKRDLTSIGSFMVMGLIGVVIASLVNLFMQSPAISFVISAASVVIFTGLTAWDVQKITRVYSSAPAGEIRSKAAVMGALTLYLDFINLFLAFLRFFGDRRR